MKPFIRTMIVLGLALVVPAQATFAQPAPERSAQDRPAFRQEQLDQILAPIALHPDPLLSQILMASTYPLEVVQAARWSRANPNLKGEAAVKAVEGMNWDPSVKSLVAFPEILQMMDERLEWTEDLGEAFLAQQGQVLDTIQGLRRRAEAQGNLQPSERIAVRREGDYIGIEPPDPGVVHVPYYDPRVAYGPWPAPAYPPVYWGPPPVYYAGWGPGFWWGPGVVVSSGFFFGAFSWPHRHVTIVHFHHHRALYARRGYVVTAGGPVAWRHDVYHRRSVPYRQAVLRQEFRQGTRNLETRREQARSATGARSTPGDRAGESRDRRPEQRVESAPRQLRQDAPVGAAPRPRAEAPVADRAPEARRGADAPPARRPDAERREPRSERNVRESRAERSEQTRQQHRARSSDDARSTRAERSSRERARVTAEDRNRAQRMAPAENRSTARADRSGRTVAEERGRGQRVERSENRPAARAERGGARERAAAEERGRGQRAERGSRENAS